VDEPGFERTPRFAPDQGAGRVSAPAAVRVAIFGDHALMAEALESMLRATGEFTVDSIHTRPETLLRAALTSPPALLLVDTGLATYGPALTAVAELRARRVPAKVVVLIDRADAHVMRLAMAHRVEGLVLKSGSSRDIVAVLKQVLAGHAVFPSDWHAALDVREHGDAVRSLSRRQLEVLQLAAHGHPNEEIAARLHISVNTVKSHLRTIFVRIGARNRVEAARILSRVSAQGRPAGFPGVDGVDERRGGA
jgi:DNA-binding NarL/FixJ family response regulator